MLQQDISNSMTPAQGDVVTIEGKEFVIAKVDDHNNKIVFEDGYSIHGAALHAGGVSLSK